MELVEEVRSSMSRRESQSVSTSWVTVGRLSWPTTLSATGTRQDAPTATTSSISSSIPETKEDVVFIPM